MKKQERCNSTVAHVLVCKKIFGRNDNETYYFEYNANEKKSYCKNQYIYKFETDGISRAVSIFRIIDILDEDEQVRNNIIKLKDNEYLRPIYSGYRWNVPDDLLEDMINYNRPKLHKEITNMLKGLKLSLYCAKCEKIDEERKKFLLDTFGVENREEFERRSLRSKARWFKEFNAYDIDCQFEISLYELKPILFKLINKNEQITNADKIALQAIYEEEIEDLVETIFLRENARTQMDANLGVDFCDETKELVWGHMSPCEIRVEFCFFWTLIKSMLSLAYIPIVILLLQDKDTKIYLYVFLAIVYLIAIVFSDEKQVSKLLFWRNTVQKGKIRYDSLYYEGLIASTTFILFSIQLAQGLIGDMFEIPIYLCADILFAYLVIIFLNMCISLVAWGATLILSISSVRKKGEYVWEVIKKIVITIFWGSAMVCVFKVLDMQKYFVEQIDIKLFDFIVVYVCFFIVLVKILPMWKKTDTVEK